jgi:hypothetical protein
MDQINDFIHSLVDTFQTALTTIAAHKEMWITGIVFTVYRCSYIFITPDYILHIFSFKVYSLKNTKLEERNPFYWPTFTNRRGGILE